jgi:cell division protein ZapA (FtsZ GTPase activity inhibitor)
MKTREIDIQILGKAFTFVLSEDVSPDEFLQIVDFVEAKITKIKNRMNELDSFKLGLLTAINIAQELHALKRENEKLRQILQNIDGLLSPETEDDRLTIRLSS